MTHSDKKKYYYFSKPITELELLEKAAEVLEQSLTGNDVFTSTEITKEYLSYQLYKQEREVFAVMFLNTKNQLIEYKALFFGTIDSASVYPREVIKEALALNASGIIVAHNHPSGDPEPSSADINITNRLKQACDSIDLRLLDHVIVGKTSVSFAERGLL